VRLSLLLDEGDLGFAQHSCAGHHGLQVFGSAPRVGFGEVDDVKVNHEIVRIFGAAKE
jgi:hypothetical protein